MLLEWIPWEGGMPILQKYIKVGGEGDRSSYIP
jgi:hypothetical protein